MSDKNIKIENIKIENKEIQKSDKYYESNEYYIDECIRLLSEACNEKDIKFKTVTNVLTTFLMFSFILNIMFLFYGWYNC